MRKLVWLLGLVMGILLTGCGCGGSQTMYQYRSVDQAPHNSTMKVVPVYVDKNFSGHNKVIIKNVIDEWNNTLNGQLRIEVKTWILDRSDEERTAALVSKINHTHEGLMILSVSEDDPLLSDFETDGVLAFVNSLGNQAHVLVVIQDHIGERNLHTILLHEFGHALGAFHVNARSLMNPYYGSGNGRPSMQVDCVDAITADQVAGYYGLDFSRMNYCSTPEFP
jgi:hypothetical protein